MILQQIYSGNGVPNFIRIARVLWKILQKHFGHFFLNTLYNIICRHLHAVSVLKLFVMHLQ